MKRKSRYMQRRPTRIDRLESRRLLTTYYVDNASGDNGSDSNSGTSLSAPFLTIQKAATLAMPGDTVNILAGTYRETVIPAHSGTASDPIIYQPYNNQKVVVSGAGVVSGWTQYSGNIYQSSAMSWTMGGQDDQLFVDGQMINYARWPNTSLDVSHPTLESAGPYTGGTTNSNGTVTDSIYDSSLTQPTGYWTGATIHIETGPTWVMESATITGYALTTVNGTSYGVISYTSTSTNTGFGNAVQGDPYYITGDPYFTNGKFQNLDSAGEFYRDPNTGKVYLWTPSGDSPASHVVEARQREWAFDLSGDSYIDITGINIFSAGINTSTTSSHLLINGITAQYVSHFENYTGNWGATLSNGSSAVGGTGIILNGNDETIENSTIAYSAGDGIYLGGNNEVVYDNVVHDVDYACVNCAAISVQQEFGDTYSANDDIGFNTLYNSGRVLINASGIAQGRIHNNRLYHAMLQCADGSDIYAYGAVANGTEIDHNIVSDTPLIVDGWDNCGIFIDGGSIGFTVDHNVIYNCEDGLKANVLQGNNYLNNSIYNCALAMNFNNFPGGTPNGLFVNNDTNGTFNPPAGMHSSNNVQSPTNPGFINAAAANFQLSAGSPEINAGLVVAPYTNGYIGSAPDIGAYEYGAAVWSAGATAAAPVNPFGALPIPWTSADIGAPPLTGSSVYYNGTFTISGSGADIWNASDQFQFADVPVSGNQTIIARVTGQTNTNVWAKAGVMFRSSSAANSAFVSVVQTPGSGVNLQYRDASGNLANFQTAAMANPAWLELARTGNVFTGYDSTDGVHWSTVASVTLALPTSGLMGLAVSSHDNSQISSATFDNVSFLVLTAPTGLSVGSVTSSSVNLSWNPVPSASGYLLQRSSDNVNFSTVATLGGVTSYADSSGLSAGSRYYYRVVATSLAGSSVPSTSAAAITLTAAPTGLTAIASPVQTTLSWTAVPGAAGYNIYRGTTPGGEGVTPLASGIASTTYADINVRTGVTYYYEVTALNGNASPLNRESVPSSEVNVSAGVIAAVPGIIQAANYDLGGQGVAYSSSWTTNPAGTYRNDGVGVEGSAGNYDIGYIQQGAWLDYTISAAAPGNYVFSPQMAAPFAGGTFHISIDGVNVPGELTVPNTGGWQTFTSLNTPAVQMTAGVHVLRLTFDTAPNAWVGNLKAIAVTATIGAPTSFTATPGVGAIALSWTAGSLNSTFNIYRGTSPGGESTTPLVTGITATTFTDTTAVAGTNYYYKIGAVSSAGVQSTLSNEASATVTNVKLTGAVIGTQTSWANNGDTIAQVFDGNLNTYFDAANSNLTNWVGLDLRAPQQITQIRYAPRAGYEWRMLGGQFQVSSTPDFSSNVATLYTISTTPIAGQFTTVAVSPGGNYRYVRYVGGTGWVNIAEMEVDGIYNAPPVSAQLNGTAIGTPTSWANNGDTIAQVFDGNLNTYFDAPNSSLTNWVGLDLGSAKNITQISYSPRAGYEWRMIGGQFQVSNTADFSSGVVTIYTVPSAPVAGQLTTVAVSVPGTYRYIRYVGGTGWVNIAEMQVFGY